MTPTFDGNGNSNIPINGYSNSTISSTNGKKRTRPNFLGPSTEGSSCKKMAKDIDFVNVDGISPFGIED